MFAYGNILSVLMQSDKTSEGSHIDLFMRKALNDWMRFSMYQAIHGAPPPLGYATLRYAAAHGTIHLYGHFQVCSLLDPCGINH
jgi:crotonobetainyl-CoA:carnitine CoA-transferase CaiB-like acyl-CoA transferase